MLKVSNNQIFREKFNVLIIKYLHCEIEMTKSFSKFVSIDHSACNCYLQFTQINIAYWWLVIGRHWMDKLKKNRSKSVIDRCSISLSRYSFSIRTLALECNIRLHTIFYNHITVILIAADIQSRLQSFLQYQRLFLQCLSIIQ